MNARVVIFDAYGTLLDVHSAMQGLAGRIGSNWEQISTGWRRKHLEYTWVYSLAAGARPNFWELAQQSLNYVAAKYNLTDKALLNDVLQAYRRLKPYPEVPATLMRLRDLHIPRAILSNGEKSMLDDGVSQAGIEHLLDDVLSVDVADVYKPDPRAYRIATERFGVEVADVAFVSGNPWDCYGALTFGFRVFHVDRKGEPDEYGVHRRAQVVADLSGFPDRLMNA